jgi:hypothetical protein
MMSNTGMERKEGQFYTLPNLKASVNFLTLFLSSAFSERADSNRRLGCAADSQRCVRFSTALRPLPYRTVGLNAVSDMLPPSLHLH